MDNKKEVKCECGKLIYGRADSNSEIYILKSVAVAQWAGGLVNLRCRACKRWINGIDETIFQTKEK